MDGLLLFPQWRLPESQEGRLNYGKVGRGNSKRRVNSEHPLLFSGEEGLDFQTWYAWTTILLLLNLRTKFENAGSLLR